MNDTAQSSSETSVDRVSGLVLTLENRQLLVPITAVAEVVNTIETPQEDAAGGALYGWINWREERIPLLSFEALAGGQRPALDSGDRMVVLNAIEDVAEQGFYALLLQALPHPLQITPETRLEQDHSDALILMETAVEDGTAAVPDLAAVEARVREAIGR